MILKKDRISILKYLSTIRHLRGKQIAGQVRNRLRFLFENPQKFYSQRIPEFGGCRWAVKQNILVPGYQNNCVSDILLGQLSFLNSKQNISWPPDWSRMDLAKLWLYNLHYFEYLWRLDYTKSKTLVLDWIENYPLRPKQIGWEPYPTSLRLINLCSVFFCKYRKQTEADTVFLRKLWQSIFTQAQWLAKHCESHLLGNHLLENGAALALAGSCFSGSAAHRWFQAGTRILAQEIPEQILDDGMHFERSAMYHCRIIYLLVILLASGNQRLGDLVREPLERMNKALPKICHPDGRIALLNDSAFGIYNEAGELIEYCSGLLGKDIESPSCGAFALDDAGYYGWRGENGNYIICDVGRIGPDYIPGHAHADIFSFELSLKGHRVIVDSGVYDYEASRMREYCRSTKAHNTLAVNGQDQCEMWAAFRVARRGYPRDVKWKPSGEGFNLSAWHDSYKRLRGRPIHYRKFAWNEPGRLVVKDTISASIPQSAVSRLHLHPDCRIERLEDTTVWGTYPAGKFKILFSGKGQLLAEESYYCPEFGVRLPNKALAFSSSGLQIETGFQIVGL